jgi:caspase domain-containing protein
MRRALCVGIDQYQAGPLQGCVSDATRMATALRRHQDDSPNFDCRLLTAPLGGAPDSVTRPILRQQLQQLFKDPARLALFFFAGHGTVNNLGGYLVTQDAARYDDGVPLTEVLQMANDSPVEEVVVILDSCFSGWMGNEPATNNMAVLREGVSILTASRGAQISVEIAGGGLFTSLVVDALEGGAANVLGEVTVPAIYAYVEGALGAWDQRPLFKAHVSQVIELRCCTPPISREALRRVPQLFPLPAEDLPLNPSFERTSAAADAANVEKFDCLQALNRVHLVTPVGAPHMYEAAMQSTACRLTPSGRYYWRLASDGRI